MNIFKTKYEVDDIDMENIDIESFGECLMASIKDIKKYCENIDWQIRCISTMQYNPRVSTMEQYEAIVDLANEKIRLMKLYKAFTDWCDTIQYRHEKYWILYFLTKDSDIHRKAERYNGREWYLMPLSENLVEYLKTNTDLKMEDLIKYPQIYKTYVSTHNFNVKFRQQLREKRKMERLKAEGKCL